MAPLSFEAPSPRNPYARALFRLKVESLVYIFAAYGMSLSFKFLK